jgi:hypothetical protein
VLYIDVQEVFTHAYPYMFRPSMLQGIDNVHVFNNIAACLDDLVCLLRPKRKCILVMNGMFMNNIRWFWCSLLLSFITTQAHHLI